MYKFRSELNWREIRFEGASIPLWQIKHSIIQQQNINLKDADILLYDEFLKCFEDNNLLIYGGSRVVIVRIPIWMSKTREKFYKTDDGRLRKNYKMPQQNYVCFRCGEKGHFIEHCPTNEDKRFDLIRIRKATGIPKAFLKNVVIENQEENPLLVTSSGQFVKAEAQIDEWQKTIRKTGQVVISDELKCKNCSDIFVIPTINECGHTFCEECILTMTQCLICNEIIQNTRLNEKIYDIIDDIKLK